MVIYANHDLRVSIEAMETVSNKIKKDGEIYGLDEMIVPSNRVSDLQGVPLMKIKENEMEFLG